MATTTATLTLVSDILSDATNFSVVATLTKVGTSTGVEHTTGMSRKIITATSKGASGEALLYTADDYAAIPYMYIKNAQTTAGHKIYIYNDSTSGDPLWLQLDAGDWGFIPMHGDKTLKAYASNNPSTIEVMVIGVDQ